MLISQLKKKSPKCVKPPHSVQRTIVHMYNFSFSCHARHLDNSRRVEYFTSCVVNLFVQYIDATKFSMPTQQSPSSKQALREQKHIKCFVELPHIKWLCKISFVALLCFSVISKLWFVLCLRKQDHVLNQQAEEWKCVGNETQIAQGIY